MKIPATLIGGANTSVLQQQSATIAALARLDPVKTTIEESIADKPEGSIALVVGSVEAYLPLAELVDPDEQRARLEKEYKEAESQVQRLEILLGGAFAEKAPENVVEKERRKLADYQDTLEKIKSQLDALPKNDG